MSWIRKGCVTSFLACSFFVFCMNNSSFSSEKKKIDFVEEMQIEVEGASLFCKTFGKGDPIVLLHGGPGFANDYFSPNLEDLGKDHRVIFYYQRGAGLSSGRVTQDNVCWDMFVQDLEAVRSSLGLDKMILVGHCWGSCLAMKYAMLYPENVEALILLSPMPIRSASASFLYRSYMKALAPYQKEIEQIKKSKAFIDGDLEAVQRYYEIMDLPHFYDQNNAKLIDHSINAKGLKEADRVVKMFFQKEVLRSFDWQEQLQQLKLPTLIVFGDYDFLSSTASREIHENIVDSRCIELKECGHFPFIEKKNDLLKSIDAFFEDLKRFR